MPEPYWPKHKNDYLLSRASDNRMLIRVTCRYCKRSHVYFAGDLIQIFGDVDVDSLMGRMVCVNGNHGRLDVNGFIPTGRDMIGLKMRRLISVKIKRIPVWKDDD